MDSADLLTKALDWAKLSASLACLIAKVARKQESVGTALQRVGWSSLERRKGPVLWFHVNGLGETFTVLPVVYRCLQEYNEKVNVLLTTPCLDVYKLLIEALPQRVVVQLVPLANPITTKSFLRKWRPQVGVFLETPFQQELAVMARAEGVNLALLNAHMPGDDVLEWHVHRTRRRILKQTLSAYSLIVPRTYVDVGRLRMFGATLGQMPGWSTDLQQASELGSCASGLTRQRFRMSRALLKCIGKRQVWIAANTLPGEDAAVARVHAALRQRHRGLLTIVAPQGVKAGGSSPQDTDDAYVAVARRMSDEKRLRIEPLSTVVKSPERLTPDVDVIIVDDPETLTSLYSYSEIVLVGGSLLPSVDGASSPAAASVAGCALLMGSHGVQYLALASDLNHAAVVASEEAAAAVAQTGATMRGIMPNGFDTPRSSHVNGYESVTFGVSQAGATAAMPGAFADRHVNMEGAAVGGSVDGGTFGGHAPTWAGLVSETRRPVLSTRPMSAPPTIPEHFQLRDSGRPSSASPFGELHCFPTPPQLDSALPWPGSGLRSNLSYGAPVAPQDPGAGTPLGLGYQTRPSVYRTALSVAAGGNAGASRSRRSPLDRYKWASSQENIGFGYSWSSDETESSDEDEGADGEGASGTNGLPSASDMEADRHGSRGGAPWALSEAPCEQVSAFQSSVFGQEAAGVSEGRQGSRDLRVAVTAFSASSGSGLSAIRSEPTFGVASSAGDRSGARAPETASFELETNGGTDGDSECGSSGFHDALEDDHQDPPGAVAAELAQLTRTNCAIPSLAVDDDVGSPSHMEINFNDSPIAFLAASASATCVFGDSGGDGGSDGEDALAGSPAFAPVACSFTNREPNGTSAVQPEDRNADEAPGPSAPADAPTEAGQDGEISPRLGGKCGPTCSRGGSPDAPDHVAVQLPNARLAQVAHIVVSRDGTCGYPSLRHVTDLRRRLRSEPGAIVPVCAVDKDSPASAPAADDAAAAGSSAAPPPASAQLSAGRALAAGAITTSSSPRTQQLDSPANFGRGQGSGAVTGPADRPPYRVMDPLDKALPRSLWVDDLGPASMKNGSTYPGDLALVSGASPPSSAKAERDASSFWASMAEVPQLGSFDHYLQSVLEQSMLSSPPSRVRSGLSSCSKRPDADGEEASVGPEVALPEMPPSAGSLELESDVAFADSPSAVDARCSFEKFVDVTVLPMPPVMDPVDTPAEVRSPSDKEGKDEGSNGDPALGAASAAALAQAADAARTSEGSDEGAAGAASDAVAAPALTLPHSPVGQQQQPEGAESPNCEFQFPEGSVPDNSGSGSPTLLATPSVHNSSGGALNLLPDGPEAPTGARPGDRPEASSAFAGVGALGQGHGRPSSHTSSPSATSSRWHSMAGIDPLTAASSSAGSPASNGAVRYPGQAQCLPVAPATVSGSNASTGLSSSNASHSLLYDSCFANQATCNWLPASNPISFGLATKDGAVGVSPTGVESSSDTLASDFMPNLSDQARLSLASASSSSSKGSAGRPGFYPVASIDKWLNSFGSLLAQPSLEVQRSQAAHDPLVWYPQQMAGQQRLSPGGTKVQGPALLEGVASGFRAPMHSPSRPLEDERSLGINPQALASVKTMLFPAAPPPPSEGRQASGSFFRPEVVTLGEPVSPARPSASSSGSSATGVNGAVASPIRQCTVGTDIVTSAFTIGRPATAASTAAAPLAAPNNSMGRLAPGLLPAVSPGKAAGSHPGSLCCNSAWQQWTLGPCPPDSSPNSANCAQDELSQLLNSPRSPVSSVRVMRTLSSSGRGSRTFAKVLMSPGRAEASSGLSVEGLESPVGPSTRASGAGATSPGGSAVWPLPVAVSSINTPRRSLQERLSAPVNQASPVSSPLRSVTSVVGAANPGGAQLGTPGDLRQPGAHDTAATQPPPSPRVGMGLQSQRSSLTDIGPIAVAAGAGAQSVAAPQEALPDETIPSSRTSCPNTPTSRAANNTSSPFRAASVPMDAVMCSQMSCNSNTSAHTGQTFEESFDAAVKAVPTRSPVRAPGVLRSVNTSPYKLPMPSPFAAAMASSSGGAYGTVFGRSLFAEEEEEAAAAMNDFDSEDDMPLSPRATSTNIHFSPKPVKVSLPLLPPPQPSVTSAAAAQAAPEPVTGVPLDTQDCAPPGDGGFAATTAAPDPGVALHIPPRLAAASVTDPALMARLHLLSAPTFSRIPSLSVTMDDDGARSKSPSPARLMPRGGDSRPNSTGRSPRITFSGGVLAVPAVPSGSGSSLPKSNLSHLSDSSSNGLTPGDAAAPGPLGAESPPDGDKTARTMVQPASRASGTSSAARCTTSRLATASGGRDESPPRSPAERTSCPRSARPSASPVKPLLQSTQSSPVPNSFAVFSYASLPIIPALSPRHSAHRPTPATPSSPPPLSPRASTSAPSPFSPPASYMSPCATDPRASPIKVQTVHKRTPADLPFGTTDETASQPTPYGCPASNFEPFGFDAASMAASGASLVTPATSSPLPAERYALPQPAFGGVSPIRTQHAAAPCPSSSAANTKQSTSQLQCIPWLQPPPRQGAADQSLEEPLLMTRASAPAGMQLLAERRQPPTPRSSLCDMQGPCAEPFDAATPQPHDLYAQRTQQQMMWDRARVESRTASAAGTPRSARALFMGGQPRSGAGEPPPLNTSLSSTTCFMVDVCVSPVEAPRSPRVATTATGLPTTHVFAPDGAATAPGVAMSYNNADEESWEVQQVRYMHSSVGRQTTSRPARVLFPTAPAAVGSTATAPPSPSWRQVSRQLFSELPPSNASNASSVRRSGSIAGSTDPLESVLSGMTVQVASPVSPQPRLLPQPASPRPLTSPVKTDTAAASPRADHPPRRTTPQRPSSPYLQVALLQRAQQTSASSLSTEAAAPPPASSANAGVGCATAGADAALPGRSSSRVALGGPHGAVALLRSPGAVVPPPRRALSPPCHANAGAEGIPTLPHLPPLPPLPRLRSAPDSGPAAVACPAQVYSEPPLGWLAASRGFGRAAPEQHPPAGLTDALQPALGTGAEAVRRSLFRTSAPQLACEDGATTAAVFPRGALPLPGMPTAAEEEALATLECQFQAAEQVAADLPIETLAPTPISVVAAAASANVADVGDGAYADLEASFSMATLSPARPAPIASAPGCRPSTAPDPHTSRQAPPQSPRTRAAGSRQVPPGHAVVYRVGGAEPSGPSCGFATLGPDGRRSGGGTEVKGWTAPAAASAAGGMPPGQSQRGGPCQGVVSHNMGPGGGIGDSSTSSSGGAQKRKGAGSASGSGATAAGGSGVVATAPLGPRQLRLSSSPSPAVTGGDGNGVASSGHGVGRRARQLSARAQGASQLGGPQDGYGQRYARPQDHGGSVAVGGSAGSPPGSAGGAPYGDNQEPVPPGARYAGQYLIPAAQLTCDPRVGPAVWVVGNEEELVTALSALLRDPVERRSRGRAAAQGAAKLASSLVSTVWGVLEDMVIAPALQQYISSNDASAL